MDKLIINKFDLDKQGIKDFTDSIVNQVLTGDLNALTLAVRLKVMEDVVKALRSNEDVKTAIITSLEEQGEFAEGSAKVVLSKTTSYDYSADAKWSEMKQEVKLLNDLIKSRETLLKSLTQQMADPDTGEIIKPATKKETSTPKVTVK